jgi:hypothetical protein
MQKNVELQYAKKIKMRYANKRTFVFDITQHCMRIILLISKQYKQKIQQKKKDEHSKKI